MNKYIYIVIVLLLMCGCGKTMYVPVESRHTIIQRDTLVQIKDTVMVDIPLEIAKDTTTTSNDTSVISTTFAQSIAYVSNGKIYHTLKQKGSVKVEVDTVIKLQKVTEYIEKPIIKEKFIPTPYIPTIYKVGLWFSIAGIILLILKFIQNLKGGI